MKAVSLLQPWAQAIAVRIKEIETRSWSTNYRGPIAIHASKRWDAELAHEWQRILATDCYITSADILLNQPEIDYPKLAPASREGAPPLPLPLGAVVATAELVACEPTEKLIGSISKLEAFWGGYSRGRFGWVLKNVKKLARPMPARGALGLWEWAGE